VYLIGSANFSNAAFAQNDEAMVAIKGLHPGLNEYIKQVFHASRPIGELPAEIAAYTWRDFLRNAYLYFRPSRAIPFAIDPLRKTNFVTLRIGLERVSLTHCLFPTGMFWD